MTEQMFVNGNSFFYMDQNLCRNYNAVVEYEVRKLFDLGFYLPGLLEQLLPDNSSTQTTARDNLTTKDNLKVMNCILHLSSTNSFDADITP